MNAVFVIERFAKDNVNVTAQHGLVCAVTNLLNGGSGALAPVVNLLNDVLGILNGARGRAAPYAAARYFFFANALKNCTICFSAAFQSRSAGGSSSSPSTQMPPHDSQVS